MMTHWHTETYKAPRWYGNKIRTRVLNADDRVMIDDLDPTVATAIVAEHNTVIVAFEELRSERPPHSPQEPI